MKKGKKLWLVLSVTALMLAGTLVAFGEAPETIINDILKIGRSGAATTKTLEFDTGDSPNNAKIEVDDTNQDIFLKADFGALGSGSAADQYLKFNEGSAIGSMPGIRWNDTDSRIEFSVDGSAWDEVGAGGASGINHLVNPLFDSSIDDWNLYDDGAVDAPVDGTGGAASQLSLSRETTDPQRIRGNLKITKAAADAQGEGVSTDMTVDRADIGNVAEISFDYHTSALYDDDDMGVYLYDKDNATLIPVVPSDLKGCLINCTFKAYAQLAYSTTTASADDYRLIVHQKTTATTAYTVEIDNAKLGPPIYNFGEGPWPQYDLTITGSNWTTVRAVGIPYKTADGTWRLKLNIAGTISVGTASITLTVTGVTFKTGQIQACAGMHSSTFYSNAYTISGTSTITLKSGTSATDGTASCDVELDGQPTWAADRSSVQMSDDASTRVLAFSGKRQAAQSLSASTDATIDFDTILYDTHSAMSSGIFTCPFSAKYSVKMAYRTDAESWSASQNVNLYLEKNGTKIYRKLWSAQAAVTAAAYDAYTVDLQCDVGDTLEMVLNSEVATGTVAIDDLTWMTIHAVQGPSAIAANENIKLRVGGSTTSISSTLGKVTFTSVETDSHGMYSAGTVTIKSPGRYAMQARIESAGAMGSAGVAKVTFYKNSTLKAAGDNNYVATGVGAVGTGSAEFDCVTGDTIEVWAAWVTTGGPFNNAAYTWFSLHRTGF